MAARGGGRDSFRSDVAIRTDFSASSVAVHPSTGRFALLGVRKRLVLLDLVRSAGERDDAFSGSGTWVGSDDLSGDGGMGSGSGAGSESRGGPGSSDVAGRRQAAHNARSGPRRAVSGLAEPSAVVVRECPVPGSAARALAWSPHSAEAAAAAVGNTAEVWDNIFGSSVGRHFAQPFFFFFFFFFFWLLFVPVPPIRILA